jgi:hypothetical protein
MRRHRVADHFFSLSDLRPDRLKCLIYLAREADVELIVHPQGPAEYAFLMGDAYVEVLSHVRLGGLRRAVRTQVWATQLDKCGAHAHWT